MSMSEIKRDEFDRLETTVNEVNTKMDKVCKDIVEMRTHDKRDSRDYKDLKKQTKKNNKKLRKLNDEHIYVKDQMKMLMWVGGAIVGLVVIAETIFRVTSIGG